MHLQVILGVKVKLLTMDKDKLKQVRLKSYTKLLLLKPSYQVNFALLLSYLYWARIY